MNTDICPSRDDAQPHLYEYGRCALCLKPGAKRGSETIEEKEAAPAPGMREATWHTSSDYASQGFGACMYARSRAQLDVELLSRVGIPAAAVEKGARDVTSRDWHGRPCGTVHHACYSVEVAEDVTREAVAEALAAKDLPMADYLGLVASMPGRPNVLVLFPGLRMRKDAHTLLEESYRWTHES